MSDGVQVESGCVIWQKGPYNVEKHPYGQKKFKFPDEVSFKTRHVHRLVNQLTNRLAEMPEGLEVSHLRHQCRHINHLTLEAPAVIAS